ncbi:ArsR/SmtB family transcription factor [Methanosalsum natronophilum]|uniref:ArsR/SmtB family transcription factor n=1 Tax=Methanosalsum natronophilum TaxID=768733 RepID=UPI00216A0A9A|nr:metalloregulator ArsR/SmtB family transcription factor [Methanosalsum natronophilum]MCS3924033.1 DNA-binding transcriptional ArsR family regulator [Methanosalsum natronophilum]
MKCCPKDNDIEEEWKLNLEHNVKLNEKEIDTTCKFFKVLSNPTRLKIAYHLLNQDYCVKALVYALDQKQNLISHHLSVMKVNGVVETFKKSNYTYYHLNPEIRKLLDHHKRV